MVLLAAAICTKSGKSI